LATAAAEKARTKSSNRSGSAHGYSHGHHGGHHVHNPLATSKRRSGSKSRDVDLSSSHAASTSTSTSTSNEGAGDLGADALDGGGGSTEGPPDTGPWPAAFRAAFYTQVWCAYHAGFEPIRDLPSLSSLPPLFFPNAASSSPSESSNALAQSMDVGAVGRGVVARWCHTRTGRH
jgi:hypothetical protein